MLSSCDSRRWSLTCARIPGCIVGDHAQAHLVQHLAVGAPTDLDLARWVCVVELAAVESVDTHAASGADVTDDLLARKRRAAVGEGIKTSSRPPTTTDDFRARSSAFACDQKAAGAADRWLLDRLRRERRLGGVEELNDRGRW